ncbi:MAG: MBL fold metallo-hydrolase [Gemmatimonadota bacterium]
MVDPNRDVGQYIEAAASEELRITHVTETHIHADFVSGSRELSRRTGARLYLSDEGGDGWRYGFAEEAGAVLLKDGDTFEVGNVRIRALHTPGHTPEHLTFLVTDGAASDEPVAALTGDFLFVGDVGRPDLLEKAAGVAGTMEDAARMLYRSLERFVAEQPDWLQIWPGHGAGSACGKGIGSIPQSTIGYEKRTSWAFGHDSEDAFVEAVLAGQPEPPRYFAEMKRINRDGPRLLGRLDRPRTLGDEQLDEVLSAGAVVVDTRSADAYAAGHVPGTLSIPLTRAFTTWAGGLVPYHEDFYLIGDESEVAEAVRDLAMIGLDRVAGVFAPAGVEDRAPSRLERIDRIDTRRLAERRRRNEVTILDIRGSAEWEDVRIPGAVHIPLGDLADRIGELSGGRDVAVHCESGARSAIAASVLEAAGLPVLDYAEGIRDWTAAGEPVERGRPDGAGEPAAA